MMICPIRCRAGSNDITEMPDCIRDRCAWWDSLACDCSIAAQANYQRTMAVSMAALAAAKKELPGATNAEQLKQTQNDN